MCRWLCTRAELLVLTSECGESAAVASQIITPLQEHRSAPTGTRSLFGSVSGVGSMEGMGERRGMPARADSPASVRARVIPHRPDGEALRKQRPVRSRTLPGDADQLICTDAGRNETACSIVV